MLIRIRYNPFLNYDNILIIDKYGGSFSTQVKFGINLHYPIMTYKSVQHKKHLFSVVFILPLHNYLLYMLQTSFQVYI